ncbi:MAG: hypothetical protein ACOYL3_28825 [Desulfuromonadaceae bacterium]
MSDPAKRVRVEEQDGKKSEELKQKKAKQDAEPRKINGGDRLLSMVRQSYILPLTDVHLSGNSVRVFSLSVMESIHTTMLKELAGGIADVTQKAELAVESKIDGMITTQAENKDAFILLKAMIVSEKAGSLESDFGLQQVVMMGVKVGVVVSTVNGSRDCLFKILRKVLAIAEQPQVGERKRRMEEDIAKLLVPRAVLMGKATLRKNLFEEELAVLVEKEKELHLKKKESDKREEQMGLAMEKMKESIDVTWGTLSENIPEDGGDGDRSALASIKKEMVNRATYALNEATRVIRRENAATEDFLGRISGEIEAKQLQLKALDVELDAEKVMSEEALRDAVKALYAKSKDLVHLAKIAKGIQELMGLPDVLQQARILVFTETRASFDALMGVEAPPPRAD